MIQAKENLENLYIDDTSHSVRDAIVVSLAFYSLFNIRKLLYFLSMSYNTYKCIPIFIEICFGNSLIKCTYLDSMSQMWFCQTSFAKHVLQRFG